MSETTMSETAIGELAGRGGRQGLPSCIPMEWVKLRSLRSTWWALGLMPVVMIGLAILVLWHYPGQWDQMSRADRASFDPTNDGFTGVALAQLIVAVVGVLAVTGEYSSGMIRSTLTAVPRRGLVLAAKAAVVGVVVLVVGEIGAFAAFLAGQAVLVSPAPHATLGQPGVLRAVVLAGVYLTLIALTGLGIGMIVRRSAVAIAIIAGLIFVLPPILLALPTATQNAVGKFLPEIIAENSLTAVKPEPFALSPWAGLGMLCLYAAVLLGAGGWLLARRDA
jgi:ABC-type transport system involved in multi-copper enzyme maturation permease subunit